MYQYKIDEELLEQKINTLAEFIGCKPEEIEYAGRREIMLGHDYDAPFAKEEFETPEGTFRVMDEDEAVLENQEYIRNYIEECGVGGFTEWFQHQIIDEYTDQDVFRDVAYDHAYEEAAGLSDDELIQECLDRDIITADEIDEDDEYTGNLDLVEELSESYQGDIDVDYNENYARWYVDTYGMDDFKEFTKENPHCLDVEEIAESVAEEDGYGHNLAGWDGVTNELNDLFIFKQNEGDGRSADFLQSIKSLEKKETEIDR